MLSLARMKSIPRSGWITHGVSLQDVESVADHSFSTCSLALLISDLEAQRGEHVNIERVLRLALLHDLSESLTFDISKAYLEYLGPRGAAIKRDLEHSAWKYIVDGLHNPKLHRSYSALQKEFDAEKTFESRIVRAADRLDILLQVIEYRRRGYPEYMLADLWSGTIKKLRSCRIQSALKIQRILIHEARKKRT
ncbi:MAG: HD family hydrolase [Candidatus Bathyarchaeia archaeon]